MPSGYSSREDPGQMKKNKQSMADLKLRRLTELNSRLREDLERERIPVSQAAKSIISYTNSTKDFMVPSIWGAIPKGEDPYVVQTSGDTQPSLRPDHPVLEPISIPIPKVNPLTSKIAPQSGAESVKEHAMADLSVRYPRVVIEFCTACKWNLRAAYFAQELLQTFGTDLGEISLQPATGGIFKVHLYDEEPGPTEVDEAAVEEHLLWDRKAEGGFPETKELKRRVRDIIDPSRNLGHVDGKKSISSEPQQQQQATLNPKRSSSPTKPQNYMGNPPIPRAINRLQHLSVQESHPSAERKFTPMDVDTESGPMSSKGEGEEREVLNSRGKIVLTGDGDGDGYCIPGGDCG